MRRRRQVENVASVRRARIGQKFIRRIHRFVLRQERSDLLLIRQKGISGASSEEEVVAVQEEIGERRIDSSGVGGNVKAGGSGRIEFRLFSAQNCRRRVGQYLLL